VSAMRRRRTIQKLARKLAEQVQTVEAICALQRTKLEAIDENGGMVTDNETRDIQSELEDAERILAVTAQDVADL